MVLLCEENILLLCPPWFCPHHAGPVRLCGRHLLKRVRRRRRVGDARHQSVDLRLRNRRDTITSLTHESIGEKSYIADFCGQSCALQTSCYESGGGRRTSIFDIACLSTRLCQTENACWQMIDGFASAFLAALPCDCEGDLELNAT